MGFTQIAFIFLFLPVSILIYLAEYRSSGKNLDVCNIVLVCAGLVFYWWAEPKLLLFFLSLVVLMYILGKSISETEVVEEKRLIMIFGVIIFAFLPVIYRYLPSIKIMTEDGMPVTMPLFTAMLVPLGITFFSLEAISYILDIYMGKAQPGSLLDVSLFSMLFPKAVCGPVVLWHDFRPQIYSRTINLDKVSSGLKRVVIGYAKKLIIADTFAAQIALIDTKVAENSTDSICLWILGILYFFRIYYDFSGYSDIAIGLCRIFGFDICENFDKPYLSNSITDFWRRWHISLGRWFKEYVYIPLGGNHSGNMYINILITFLLAALWHGWTLNILLWGILNAFAVMLEKVLNRCEWYKKKPLIIGIAATVILVFFGWMLFRAPDIETACETFKALVISPDGDVPNFTWHFFMTRRIVFFLVIAAIGAFGGFHLLADRIKTMVKPDSFEYMEKILLLLIFALDIMFALGNNYTPFVYSLIP